MKHLLYGAILLLLLVIIAEIAYLFYRDSFHIPKKTNSTTLPITPTITEPTYETALDQDTIKRIEQTRSTGHEETIMNQRFSGVIYKLSTTEYDLGNGLEEVHLLTLTEQGITDENLMNIFVISKEQMNILELTQKDNDLVEPIAYSDLQVGDRVIIEVAIDMTRPITHNVVEYIITRVVN